MLLYRYKQREQPLKEENKTMKEFRLTFIADGRVYKRYQTGFDLNDAKEKLYKYVGHVVVICSEEVFL